MHYSLCEYILDIFQNSVEAEAKCINLNIYSGEVFKVKVEDNGKGMTYGELKNSFDPFFTNGIKHPGRNVGLGIPFLSQLTESAGGDLQIKSEIGEGTVVNFSIDTNYLDAPPIGDLSGTISRLFCFNGDYELNLYRKNLKNQKEYTISRSEIIETLGELETVGSQKLFSEFLESHECELEDTAA